ncbi:hypothetical protein WJT86_05240 [Microvirga sp. W0021]|uniref:Uncharacterized protein n=1 Tax=Hohaiivirga grylli TaxID=3133970 RepID=A0ABV0BHM3_9HYPH
MLPFTGHLARKFSGYILGMAILACPASVLAANYEFVPAPQIDLNRMYRIDKVTGEVSACQYGVNTRADGAVGVTLCYQVGEGAGPQTPGEYGLVATRHVKDGGIFRVNYRTGQMSVCYVFEGSEPQKVVCTPPGAAPGEAAGNASDKAGPSR